MDFKKDAPVYNASGEKVGTVNRVVIDPKGGQVTHIVVSKGFLLKQDKVMPADWILMSDSKGVWMKENSGTLDTLPDFLETEFVPSGSGLYNQSDPNYAGDVFEPLFWYPSVGNTGLTAGGIGPWGWSAPSIGSAMPADLQTEENVPSGTIALQEGAQVVDSTGKAVGSVDHVITNQKDQQVTHLVVTKGVFDQKKKLIPANWIEAIKEDGVKLSVDQQVLNRLKDYED